jgi:hypothetical protein
VPMAVHTQRASRSSGWSDAWPAAGPRGRPDAGAAAAPSGRSDARPQSTGRRPSGRLIFPRYRPWTLKLVRGAAESPPPRGHAPSGGSVHAAPGSGVQGGSAPDSSGRLRSRPAQPNPDSAARKAWAPHPSVPVLSHSLRTSRAMASAPVARTTSKRNAISNATPPCWRRSGEGSQRWLGHPASHGRPAVMGWAPGQSSAAGSPNAGCHGGPGTLAVA